MNEFLYVEKYRPQTIEDTILPEQLKETFKDFVEIGEIPNLLLCGSAGVGKTTIAKALCNELDADFIVINGSDEGRLIDTLRTKIKNFASTVSLSSSAKVVILDEADYISADSVQPALRNFIEEFSSNCRFIFTCNYKNRIIPALHSRCSVVDFKIAKEEKPELAQKFSAAVLSILDGEGVKYKTDVVAQLVVKFFPDFRRVLNELQKHSISGTIDANVLTSSSNETFDLLIKFLKEGDFGKMRKWVAENIDNDHVRLYRQVYDSIFTKLEQRSLPQAVLTIADYSYKSAFVADQEINLTACIVELMMECKFK